MEIPKTCPICYSERNLCQVVSSINNYCDEHLIKLFNKTEAIIMACPEKYQEMAPHQLDRRLLDTIKQEMNKRKVSSLKTSV